MSFSCNSSRRCECYEHRCNHIESYSHQEGHQLFKKKDLDYNQSIEHGKIIGNDLFICMYPAMDWAPLTSSEIVLLAV